MANFPPIRFVAKLLCCRTKSFYLDREFLEINDREKRWNKREKIHRTTRFMMWYFLTSRGEPILGDPGWLISQGLTFLQCPWYWKALTVSLLCVSAQSPLIIGLRLTVPFLTKVKKPSTQPVTRSTFINPSW